MKLLEHQGKSILSKYGIAVPNGSLWPALPDGAARFAVKAQVRSGGRGKAGGIRFADSAAEAGAAARALLAAEIGGHAVTEVLVEERLDIAHEFYLAVVIDRDARRRTILASPDGGVEIESVPPARLLRVPIDPLLGPRPFHLRRVAGFLAPPEAARAAVEAAVAALYALAEDEDAVLAEINPLAVTAAGDVVAADAKLVLDPRAAYRQPGQAGLAAPPEGSAIERAVAAAGGTAVEIDPEGDVVGIISGAGVTMATCDMLVDLGARVRCVIDLGGGPIGNPEGMVPVFRAVAALEPRVTFINAYLHSSLADDFARAVVAAHRQAPVRGRVLLRLLGRNAEEGRRILAPLGFEVHEDLVGALEAVVGAARAAA